MQPSGRLRHLLRAFRLDDLLALLFTLALLLVSALYSIPLFPASLRNFFVLLAYYAVAFGLARALGRSPVPGRGAKRLLLALVLAVIAGFTLVAPGGVRLETLKNFAVLSFPFLLAGGLAVVARAGPLASGAWRHSLRDFAPFLVSEACYLTLHDVVHRLSPVDRDGWLIAADVWMFGGHMTQWLEPLVHPALTEWFSATYSLFLFFPLTLALYFTARGERAALRHLLTAVVLCNYLGYLGYLLVPAIGPMYTLTFQVPLSGGWFYQIKESLDQLARVPRDCFPSLHTANTFVVLLIVGRYARGLGWIYHPLGLSCIAATLYLRYHYTVDVLAGFLLGGAVTWAVPGMAGAWERVARGLEATPPEGERAAGSGT